MSCIPLFEVYISLNSTVFNFLVCRCQTFVRIAPSNGFALVRIQRIRFAADCRQSRQARPLVSFRVGWWPRNSSNTANNYCRLFNLKSWYYKPNKQTTLSNQVKNILQHINDHWIRWVQGFFLSSTLVKFLGLLYQGSGFALLNPYGFVSCAKWDPSRTFWNETPYKWPKIINGVTNWVITYNL